MHALKLVEQDFVEMMNCHNARKQQLLDVNFVQILGSLCI